jgi:hypothetical protein
LGNKYEQGERKKEEILIVNGGLRKDEEKMKLKGKNKWKRGKLNANM